MTIERSAASLLGLDAVVIDTETTGLDTRQARIVEVAAMPLTAGRLDAERAFRCLVDPGIRIPPEAARVHGIDNAAVSGTPDFAAVWPELDVALGRRVVIGHTVDFDLAVLGEECRRVGAVFEQRAALDVRVLAELAEPKLPDFSLEGLAAWLEIPVTARHSALGDVTTTGKIFCALVPRLRDRGIRTIAEAIRSASALRDEASRSRRLIGSNSAPAVVTALAEPRPRIDVRLYSERVESIMTAPPRRVSPAATLDEVIRIFSKERISSVFVSGEDAVTPGETGIVTERDALRALDVHGGSALTMPASAIMSRPLQTVPSDALSHIAVARMNRLRVRHLGVTDAMGKVVGALSARDLLRLRAESGVELGDEIEQAADVAQAAHAWTKVPQVAADLLREELSARQIAEVISHGCVQLTAHAVALAERDLLAQGLGPPPARYAAFVLGSAGRGESLLALDQDNGLVFADDAPEDADRWFEALGSRMADILHEAGMPYCSGGVMAKNATWRGSFDTWKKRIDGWIFRSSPADLLSVDIFFDLLGVSGDPALAEDLRQHAFDAARGQAAFAKLLLGASGPLQPALNWYGGIRTVNGRIDLKKAGLFGIVRSARALAICRHITARSTQARIEAIKARHAGSEGDLDALAEAQGVFIDLILRQQIVDIERGRPLDNTVEIKRLTRRDRERCRAALRAVAALDAMTEAMLFTT